MIILCCGMIRSGSTLQYQITSDLVESRGRGRRIGFVESCEQLTAETQPQDAEIVAKCHWPMAGLELFNGKIRYVYIYRDIRDVIVSWMRLNQKPFWWIVKTQTVQKALSAYHFWTNHSSVMVSDYSAVMEDTAAEVSRIAQFVDLPISSQEAVEVAKRFSPENQKKRIANTDYDGHRAREGRSDAPDPVSLLKEKHIVSGESGIFHGALTWYQLGYLESVAGDWMRQVGLKRSSGLIGREASRLLYMPLSVAIATVRFLRRFALRSRPGQN